MGNHYHLLLETPEANLVTGMKWLQGTYTQRYNARHRKRGHLFQGRYRAVPVEAELDQYFQGVSTDIHLHPARAKQIRLGEQKLWEYPWSSYPLYVRGKPSTWLITERVLGSVGLGPAEWHGYEVYLETRVLELGLPARREAWEAAGKDLRRGWYVGGSEFRQGLLARIKEAVQGVRRASQGGAAQQAHEEAEAERMLAQELAVLRMHPEALAATPKGPLEKQVLAWWLCERTTVSRRWVAERLQMGHESRVGKALHTVEKAPIGTVLALKTKLTSLQV
jgi:hypothetical protein